MLQDPIHHVLRSAHKRKAGAEAPGGAAAAAGKKVKPAAAAAAPAVAGHAGGKAMKQRQQQQQPQQQQQRRQQDQVVPPPQQQSHHQQPQQQMLLLNNKLRAKHVFGTAPGHALQLAGGAGNCVAVMLADTVREAAAAAGGGGGGDGGGGGGGSDGYGSSEGVVALQLAPGCALHFYLGARRSVAFQRSEAQVAAGNAAAVMDFLSKEI